METRGSVCTPEVVRVGAGLAVRARRGAGALAVVRVHQVPVILIVLQPLTDCADVTDFFVARPQILPRLADGVTVDVDIVGGVASRVHVEDLVAVVAAGGRERVSLVCRPVPVVPGVVTVLQVPSAPRAIGVQLSTRWVEKVTHVTRDSHIVTEVGFV